MKTKHIIFERFSNHHQEKILKICRSRYRKPRVDILEIADLLQTWIYWNVNLLKFKNVLECRYISNVCKWSYSNHLSFLFISTACILNRLFVYVRYDCFIKATKVIHLKDLQRFCIVLMDDVWTTFVSMSCKYQSSL